MAGLTNFDNVVDMDFLHLRILTMIKLLKWQSHGSVYVNVIRKSNNSANNSSNGIPTKYRFVVCQPRLCKPCRVDVDQEYEGMVTLL